MAIEIKSRYGGKVLYTAESAAGVRAALVEAASKGADLRGADLRGAYLRGADLRGAYLQGADLRGAYLQGADLRGAYLQGAYLQGELWKQVATTLTLAAGAMNDQGRHWIKGALEKSLEDGSKAYCSVGSVQANSEGTVQALALWLLGSVTASPIENFNDDPGTTWEDVKAVFAVAVRNAERFAGSTPASTSSDSEAVAPAVDSEVTG